MIHDLPNAENAYRKAATMPVAMNGRSAALVWWQREEKQPRKTILWQKIWLAKTDQERPG